MMYIRSYHPDSREGVPQASPAQLAGTPHLKHPAHRASIPGEDGSSFDRLTMTAHHDDGNVILSLSKNTLTIRVVIFLR